ncbi:DUF5958 family protein [Streptomyces sp. NPDC048193]|uniref:DUF5958 family protein n=1 Tax=unclassified Streptomyces TaxID=2593676 RepID=UPI00343799C6
MGSLPEDDQRKVLHALVLFGGQAPARQEDVPESIARSGIRPTRAPAVTLTKWRFGMGTIPAHELTKSFRPLVAPFSIADTRRRRLHCAGGCGHAWHNRAPGGRRRSSSATVERPRAAPRRPSDGGAVLLLHRAIVPL